MITLPRPTRQVVPRPTHEVVRRHTATMASTSSASRPWTGAPPGLASASRPARRRRRHRFARRSGRPSTPHASRYDQPWEVAASSRSSSSALVAASTRLGTRPPRPNRLFPRYAGDRGGLWSEITIVEGRGHAR